MKSLIVFLLVFISTKTSAEICAEDTLLPESVQHLTQDYLKTTPPAEINFSLQPDGTFNLSMVVEFPLEADPRAIMKELIDPENIIKNSNLTKEVTLAPNSKIKKFQASDKPEPVFSKNCKSFSCATTKSNCHLPSISARLVEYKCSMDLAHKKTSELFFSGESNYICHKSASKNLCTMSFTGRPKPIDLMVLSRSSSQLAIAGAVETAMGIMKQVHPFAKDKVHLKKLFGNVEKNFYPKTLDEYKVSPRKSLAVEYK